MRLTQLTLENFRNYGNFELRFDLAEPLMCIVGENAQGKTNLLEAIYMLALTKSFHTNIQEEIIQWSKEYTKIQGMFNAEIEADLAALQPIDPINLEVFIGYPPHPKKVLKKNGLKINTENFIGLCQVVFFHPASVNMLYFGPELRRTHIDILNLQINKKFYLALKNYRQILKQRNALLKAIKAGRKMEADLQIWNEQLAAQGSFIMMERVKTLMFMQQYLQDYYQRIAGNKDTITVKYQHSIAKFWHEQGQNPYFDNGELFSSSENCISTYKKTLLQTYSRDLELEWTTIGPHRDDIQFMLNGRKLAAGASRGEYRCVLLALKLLELKFFEENTAQKPILLLDDVFSELDSHRQRLLMQTVSSHQTIITTAHLDDFIGYQREHGGLGKVLKIENGCLEAKR